MNRNEYRRAFIMLRTVLPGYGGHVRLERRTLTGSMYFTITAPQGVNELSAVLVGQRNGEYYAAAIGALTRDRRGQLARAWQFDPRDIDARPLEAYAWLAVVATGGRCALALTGNVEGSRPVDLQALERAACAPFECRRAPAADLPARDDIPAGNPSVQANIPDEAPPVQEDVPAEASPVLEDAPVGDTPGPEATPDAAQPGSDVRIYTLTRTRLRRARHRQDAPAPDPEAAADAATPGPVPQVMSADADISASESGLDPAAPEPVDEPVVQEPADTSDHPGSAAAVQPLTAARQLGLDITVPWPDAAGPLRRLFATQSPAEPAPMDCYTYIRMPMPGGSGYPESLVGLTAGDGRITGIRHALPGRRAPEPPAGMEGYTWVPSEGEQGFWVTEEG